MTLLPLLSGATQRYTVIGILIFLFASMVIAVCVFAYSIWKQRQYNSTSLPSLDVPVEDEEEEVGESAFSLDAIAGEEISKGAFTSSFDDELDFHSLPPLGQVAPEPEEERLPDLMSLAATQEETAPPAFTGPEPEVQPQLVEELEDAEDEDWPVPGGAPGVTPESLPPVPVQATSYDSLPLMPEVSSPLSPIQEEDTALVDAPFDEVTPDPSWAEEEVQPFTDEDSMPPAPDAYPMPTSLPAYRADEEAPDWAPVAPAPAVAKAEKRGFRKLRMPAPVDKINEELTGDAPDDEEALESSPGRRRRDVPTDSTPL